MPRNTIVNAAQLFATEVRHARQLGFRLQVHPGQGVAHVRLVPETDRARAFCAEHNAQAIEARQDYPTPADTLDAIHAALAEALNFARHGGTPLETIGHTTTGGQW